MAIQKLGAAMPTTAKNLPIWSKMESRLMAERIPRGIPTIMVRMKATPASCRVAGRRCSRMSRAGTPRMWDIPKSAWTTFPRKLAYCTGRGRSSPMFFFICS